MGIRDPETKERFRTANDGMMMMMMSENRCAAGSNTQPQGGHGDVEGHSKGRPHLVMMYCIVQFTAIR